MSIPSNRPTVDQVKERMTGADLTGIADDLFNRVLAASIADIEDQATTSLDGRRRDERYDGNTTAGLVLRQKPVTSVILAEVQTPILGYIRTYQPDEIKVYRRQGFLRIFTYKLAVEQAMLNTLDYQAWGTIFPPLPQAVRIIYTYGYPQYDETDDKTWLDGGDAAPSISLDGDRRDPVEQNWLTTLQEAIICDAAACSLAQVAGLKVGAVQSVSFDGYSRTNNVAAYQAQVQALVDRRDRLLGRRKRRFTMATIG